MTDQNNTDTNPIDPDAEFVGARITIEIAIDSDTILREFFHPFGSTNDVDNAGTVVPLLNESFEHDNGEDMARKMTSYLEDTDDRTTLAHLCFKESTKPKVLSYELVTTDDRDEFADMTNSELLGAFSEFREAVHAAAKGDLDQLRRFADEGPVLNKSISV